MRSTLLLAWRYVGHHRIRTLILVVSIALVGLLPLAVSLLIARFETAMMARARSVPLVVGARASPYDLLLSTLYYRGRMKERLTMAEVEALREGGLGDPIPVSVDHTARGYPIVGTTLDFFERLGRRCAAGDLPLVLGDAVLGATVAADLGLGPGDRIPSDPKHLYDLSATYPLKLRIVGVLAPSASPDDRAVFVDLKTDWVIDGLCHGHQDVTKEVDPAAVFRRTDDNVAVDGSIPDYNEITPANIDSFHFHGDPKTFPVTAVLVWPKSEKGRTLLKAHYGASKTARIIVPTAVVEELMGFLFRLKRFFDANVVLVTAATGLFLTLIVLLSLRIRKRERETLYKIGCSRATMFWLQSAELGMIVLAGIVLAVLLALAFFGYVVRFHGVI
jgi:putative ABC transport system permease protein